MNRRQTRSPDRAFPPTVLRETNGAGGIQTSENRLAARLNYIAENSAATTIFVASGPPDEAGVTDWFRAPANAFCSSAFAAFGHVREHRSCSSRPMISTVAGLPDCAPSAFGEGVEECRSRVCHFDPGV